MCVCVCVSHQYQGFILCLILIGPKVTTRGSPTQGDRSPGLQTLGTHPRAPHPPVHLCPSPNPSPQKEPGNTRRAPASSASPASKLKEAESGRGHAFLTSQTEDVGHLGNRKWGLRDAWSVFPVKLSHQSCFGLTEKNVPPVLRGQAANSIKRTICVLILPPIMFGVAMHASP